MTAFTHIGMRPANPADYCKGLIPVPEAASSTWLKGAVLEIESGLANEYDQTGQMFGLAMEAGHNDSTAGGTDCLVLPFYRTGLEFYVSLQDAVTTTQVDTDIGILKDGTSNRWVGDTGTTGQARITELTGLRENGFHANAVATDTGVVIKIIIDRSAIVGA